MTEQEIDDLAKKYLMSVVEGNPKKWVSMIKTKNKGKLVFEIGMLIRKAFAEGYKIK